MLSEQRQRQIILQEPKFVEKLQRMEALSIRLSKLQGRSRFTLQRSPKRPEGMWILDISWSNQRGEVNYVTLEKRVGGRVFRKWQVFMQYQREPDLHPRTEGRYMFEFDDSVVAVLDTLSDELEEQIARASRATQEHREQFRRVVEEHPRKERNRFDQIDPRP